jgi:hypothetical protein
MSSGPTVGGGFSLIKGVVGLVSAIIGLGDPHEDDAALTVVNVEPNPSDGTCVDLTTVMRFISSDAPAVEHAVTLYSIYAQP